MLLAAPCCLSLNLLISKHLFKSLIPTPAPSLIPNLDEARRTWTSFQQWKHLSLSLSLQLHVFYYILPLRKKGIPCSSLRCCSATPPPSQELNATGSVKIFSVNYITVVEGADLWCAARVQIIPIMNGGFGGGGGWAVNNREVFPCGFCVCLLRRLFSLCCASQSGVCLVCCSLWRPSRPSFFFLRVSLCLRWVLVEVLLWVLKIWYAKASRLSAPRFLFRMPSCYTTASCQADTLKHSRKRAGKTAVIRILKGAPAENTHCKV